MITYGPLTVAFLPFTRMVLPALATLIDPCYLFLNLYLTLHFVQLLSCVSTLPQR